MDRFVIALGLVLFGCGECAADVVRWERGYRTDYVVATRLGGDGIAFNLPRNPYSADRARVEAWLWDHGVVGYRQAERAGATIYTKVRGVYGRKAIDRFLVRFLPRFDTWVRENLSQERP